MKKLTFFILSLFILSCEQKIKPGSMRDNQSSTNAEKIRYFKDYETNKCFAERGYGTSYSFTCVECDSLVLEKIKSLEYDYKNN